MQVELTNEVKSAQVIALGSPWMWEHYPFIQVERRTHRRPGQPFCLVFADETGWIRPAVYFVTSFPPEDFDPEMAFGFTYPDLEALVDDGWHTI